MLNAQHAMVPAACCSAYILGSLQGKVVDSMPKQNDPQDPEMRQLPSEGLSCDAVRQRLNHKVVHNALCWAYHSMQSMTKKRHAGQTLIQ